MRDPREVDRRAAAAMGAEAVAITQAGRYTAPSGAVVEIADMVEDAVAGTFDVPPGQRLDTAPGGQRRTRVEVANESTLAAARRLHAKGEVPVALNFASARNPGGGFLNGARAQEESLCRSSALHACLQGRGFYEHHTRARDPMYSAWMVYSPAVPVFREDDGPLLERPWTCGFITAAAPNAKALGGQRLAEQVAAVRERAARVLALAVREGHTRAVLGAWGCGAFGGDAERMAEVWAEALERGFRGAFAEVVFAVLDTSPGRRTIGPFERRLGRG